MLRDRRLARSIADTGFAAVRRQLEYKTRWRGSRQIVADRWFPSLKTCPDRGVVTPRVRAFRCESCGPEIDRDPSAARDLAALVVRSTTGTGGGRRPGAPGLERTRSRPEDPRHVGWWQ
ncbi:zinc ribbon domain-containing protein [Lentzea miocenica]|uniref:zinc ribbon domain-containing protein n=1 Tax=Lentzea miocenica TaxID=3095431 RepID=UPI003873BF66